MFFESLTPSPCGHSPYLICDEQRESVDTLMCFLCCGYLFNSSVTSCYLPYILRCKTQWRGECFAMPQGIGGVVKGIFSFLV